MWKIDLKAVLNLGLPAEVQWKQGNEMMLCYWNIRLPIPLVPPGSRNAVSQVSSSHAQRLVSWENSNGPLKKSTAHVFQTLPQTGLGSAHQTNPQGNWHTHCPNHPTNCWDFQWSVYTLLLTIRGQLRITRRLCKSSTWNRDQYFLEATQFSGNRKL